MKIHRMLSHSQMMTSLLTGISFMVLFTPISAYADGITFDGGSGSGLGNPILGPGTPGYTATTPNAVCDHAWDIRANGGAGGWVPCGWSPPVQSLPNNPQTTSRLQAPQSPPPALTPMQSATIGVAAGVAATLSNAISDGIVKMIMGDPKEEARQALLKHEEEMQAQLRAAAEARKAAEEQRQKELAFANQKGELLQDMNGVQETLGIASDTTGFPQLHQQVPFPQGWTDTPWLDQMQRDLSANEPPPPVATSYPQPKNPLPPPKASQPAAQKPSPTQRATSSSEVDLSGKQGIVDPADLKKGNPNYNGYLPLARSVPSPQPPAEPWYKNIEDSLPNLPGNVPGGPQPAAIVGVRGCFS